MDLPSKAIVDVLMYLMPGFITAALMYALTPAPRPIPFERVIQALIFTIIIQVAVTATKYGLVWAGKRAAPWGPWTDGVALVWSVGLAFALGLFVVWVANSDRIHGVLRKLRITHQTSYSSEWYGQFCRHQGYVVLHLTGNRRLLGWAEEWPSTPDVGHFVVASAQWLVTENGENKVIELAGVHRILIKAQDVEMVEMMRPLTEEETHGRSEGTNAAAAAAESGPNRQGRNVQPTATVPAGATATTPAQEVREESTNGRQQSVEATRAIAQSGTIDGRREGRDPATAPTASSESSAGAAAEEVILRTPRISSEGKWQILKRQRRHHSRGSIG